MLHVFAENFAYLMDRGGVVMWPLLVLSLAGVTLMVERAWFWVGTNNPSRCRRVEEMARLLRHGETKALHTLTEHDQSVYGRFVRVVMEEGASDAAITEAVERQRPRIERFMPTLSTIISAAPMLGILGTVTGIISSFHLLSSEALATDPRKVGEGIAEALLTTAAGLVIAIIVLFAYNAYRAQIDRTLGRLEMLAAAAARKNPTPNKP
ncbi:MAG: hypothetical protein GC164_13940 [Phycisphaera sp.]|nr:hypothetical protein [Phycisphaera sp.]